MWAAADSLNMTRKTRSFLIFIVAFMALSEVMTSVVTASEDADARVARLAIEACLKKAREIRAYRYTHELYHSVPPIKIRNEFLQRLRGTVVVPDKLQLTEQVSPSSNAEGGTIVIGDRHYYRNSSSDSWHETRLSSDLRRMVHPMQTVLDLMKDRKAVAWTSDPSKNQLKLKYKRKLMFDVDSEVEVLIDQNNGYILEVEAKARGLYPQTLKTEEGWEQRELWSFYDINDPKISISIPRLIKE